MTKIRAQALIVVVAMVVIGIAMPGLVVLGANGATIALAVIIPACIASHLVSRVVMHYGDDADESERLRR